MTYYPLKQTRFHHTLRERLTNGACNHDIGNIDYKDAPFTQFVQSAYGLTDKVLTAVVYAIGFDGNDEGMWE